jgi:hypothetical protein
MSDESGCACRNKSEGAAPDARPSSVYALGRIQHRFPSPGTEREFQAAARRLGKTAGTDAEVVHATLSDRKNRYLAREIVWSLSVEGIEVYVLVPAAPDVLDDLIDSLRAAPSRLDLDLVLGERGPLSDPGTSGGLQLPMVRVDVIRSFTEDELIGAVPAPEGADKKEKDAFRASARAAFQQIQQLADNAGDASDHRALNFLAVQAPSLYASVARAEAQDESLSSITSRVSRLSGSREVVDVIFAYVNRRTDVMRKEFIRVDVTEKFPFLVTKMAPYFDR